MVCAEELNVALMGPTSTLGVCALAGRPDDATTAAVAHQRDETELRMGVSHSTPGPTMGAPHGIARAVAI